jgi:hypothetical protein
MNIRKYKAFAALGWALAFPLAATAAVNFFDPVAGAPALLSQTGVYSDIAAKKPDTAMNYFEVNAALWSDGAAKSRWIILPPGTRITYKDNTDYFDYPNKTIFVKNFYLDTVLNDGNTRRYWETRLLVNKHDEGGFDFWYGFSYRWKADGSDAVYVGTGGLDTVANYYPRGITQPLSYKKWTFPSADACGECHKTGTSSDDPAGPVTARAVLGFFPVQLKRPSSLVPGKNQVDVLFDSGVFAGTAPTDSMKRVRWKGIGEALPPVGDPRRFATLDTMARSYIGANCSGCHGTRNITVRSAAPFDLNYDFYQLKPEIEFGARVVGSANVDVLEEDTTVFQDGRYKYMTSVRRAGLDMSPGSPWDMSFPKVGTPAPTLIQAGFPSLSMMLYRQLAMRRTPWRDSIRLAEELKSYDPNNWKSWIFANPWGSQAWRTALAAHSVKINDVMTFGGDGLQMPPLATHLPDTAAMKILGEWAKTYRTLVRIQGQDSIVNVRGRTIRIAAEGARIQNRQLIVPADWSGKAQMFSIGGRAYPLSSVGKGRYTIPQSAPTGLYIFKVGNRTFRASVLR